jgi:hypothetical protein
VRRRKGDTAKLAASLAPLEEQRPASAVDEKLISGGASQETGAIVVDRSRHHIPNEMLEGPSRGRLLGMEPVVLVILAFMLCFIVFIAWQISQMPAE